MVHKKLYKRLEDGIKYVQGNNEQGAWSKKTHTMDAYCKPCFLLLRYRNNHISQ